MPDDLEGRITDWRRAMARHLRGRDDVVDELESHLRDQVEELVAVGHDQSYALEVAQSRIGLPSDIAAEFAKVPPLRPWLPVRLAWAAGAAVAAWLAWSLTPRLLAGGLNALLAFHMAAVTLGYVASLLVGFLAACFLVTRFFRDLDAGQARSLGRCFVALSGLAVGLTAVGAGLGFLCPFEKLGRFWGLDTREAGGLAILVWDVVMLGGCLWVRRDRIARVVPWGLIGSAVVTLGWFGAAAVERHSYGPSADYPPVVLLAVGQVAFSCTAFAPAGWVLAKKG